MRVVILFLLRVEGEGVVECGESGTVNFEVIRPRGMNPLHLISEKSVWFSFFRCEKTVNLQ